MLGPKKLEKSHEKSSCLSTDGVMSNGQTFEAKDENIQIVPCWKAGTWRGSKIWTWATSRKEISFKSRWYKMFAVYTVFTCSSVFVCVCVFVEVTSHQKRIQAQGGIVVKPGQCVCVFCLKCSSYLHSQKHILERKDRGYWDRFPCGILSLADFFLLVFVGWFLLYPHILGRPPFLMFR